MLRFEDRIGRQDPHEIQTMTDEHDLVSVLSIYKILLNAQVLDKAVQPAHQNGTADVSMTEDGDSPAEDGTVDQQSLLYCGN